MEKTFAGTLEVRQIDDLQSRSVQAKPYRSENGFEVKGLFVLIAGMLAAGAVLGFAVHWVSQWFYLILLFPVLMGGAMGKIGAVLCKSQKVRNPWVGGAIGLLGGAFAMLVVHYLDYRNFVQEIKPQNQDEQSLVDAPADVQQEVLNDPKSIRPVRENMRLFLLAQNVRTFPQYMHYRAKEGVSLKKTGSSGNGANLGYWGTWIYWAVEIGLLAFISFGILKDACRQPFCAKCDEWKKVCIDPKAPLLPGDKNELLRALEQRTLGDFFRWVERAVEK